MSTNVEGKAVVIMGARQRPRGKHGTSPRRTRSNIRHPLTFGVNSQRRLGTERIWLPSIIEFAMLKLGVQLHGISPVDFLRRF